MLREFWRDGDRLIPIFERAVEVQKVWGVLQQVEPSTVIADAYESELRLASIDPEMERAGTLLLWRHCKYNRGTFGDTPMIQKSSLNAETVRQLIDSQLEERLLVCPRDGKDFNCEVGLPLHWSDGDVVSVFIGERNGLTIVHDACKIKGELFRAEERGVSSDDLENVERAVKALEVQFDQNTGIAFAEVDPENLLYWLMEMGRIMTMVPHMYPQPSVEKLSEGRHL